MMYDFNADEIFEIAGQMERNGSKFYRMAASAITDETARSLLEKLADMEDNHEKVFSQMRAQLTAKEKETTVFDPQNEAVAYLRALADMRVFFDKTLDTSSMETILKDAITAEKDSIVFYLGMREAVPREMGAERLDEIIKEEMGHIRLLSQELGAYRKE
ncbi:MAG: ferritin family protein [Desulfobacterales bacterium]|jgi:rubrerythrin|nr:ferritin family protein [Desulfobacterales bacterium]